MKTYRSALFSAAALSAVLMAQADDGSGVGGAATGGEATAGEAEATAGEAEAGAAEARKRAPAANFLPIVRGRLPLIFVHAIRFNKVLQVMGNKDLANKFGTSVGKVFDIKKGRNFGYVTADFKPTAEDIAAAESHIAQAGAANAKGLTALGDKMVMQTTLDEYKGAGLATAEQAAAQSASRTVARAPRDPSAPKAPRKPKAEKAEKAEGGAVQANAAGSADDLLA